MKFDEFLTYIGDFGPYQQRMYFLITLPMFLTGMQLMAPVFILATPRHRCAIPGMENDTFAVKDSYHQYLVDKYVPRHGNASGTSTTYSQCSLYKRPFINQSSHSVNETHERLSDTDEVPCDRWVYDQSVFTSTVTTQCNLVCENGLFVAHATTAVTVGSFVAFLVVGAFSDRYGRKLAYMISLLILGASATISVWVPNIWVFIVFRFLTGFGFGGFFNGAFVFAMEFIGPSKRMILGILINNVWGVGLFIHAGLAYALRDWSYLQLATAVPYFLFLIYWWILSDSPRWLLASGRKQQAEPVLKKMAKVNHLELSEASLSEMTVEQEESSGGFLDLFKNRQLAVMTIVVYFNWLVVAMVYYGLSLGVGNIGGDIFMNYFLTSLVEFIGYLACVPALLYVGRKVFHTGCMILAGLALVLIIFPEKFTTSEMGMLILSLIGKFGSSAAFATIYLFTAELFPTIIRTTAMCTSAVFAALGTFIAPYIVQGTKGLDDKMDKLAPMLIFGGASVVAGLLALLLPETRNRHLPEKLGDLTEMTKR